MNVTDRLYTEWAWRTKSGAPDINNPEDKAILNSLIAEFTTDSKLILENNLADTVIDLVTANKDNEKLLQRVYRTLQASPFISDFKARLQSAGLSKDLFDSRNLFDEIIAILQKGEESSIQDLLSFQENSNLPNKGNIYRIASEVPQKKVQDLANLTGTKGSVTMGKGEILFPILFSDTRLKDDGAGDLQRGSKTVELKAIGVSKEGKKAGGGRFGVSRSFENYKPISSEIAPGYLKSIIADLSKATPENINDVYSNINKYLDKIYPGNTQEVNETNVDKLRNMLIKAAVESYIKIKKIDEFLLFDPVDGAFTLISPSTDILNAIDTGDVTLTTATSPQLISFK